MFYTFQTLPLLDCWTSPKFIGGKLHLFRNIIYISEYEGGRSLAPKKCVQFCSFTYLDGEQFWWKHEWDGICLEIYFCRYVMHVNLDGQTVDKMEGR